MASLAVSTTSAAVLANWVPTTIPQQQQQQQLSFCCSSAFCSSPSNSPAQQVSMFSQFMLQTKTPLLLRKICSRGYSLFDGGSASSRHFGAAANSGGAVSMVVQSSSRNSAIGVVDEEQSSSTGGETVKDGDGETRKNTANRYLIGRSEESLEKLCMSLGAQKYRGRQIHQLIYKTKAKHVDDFLHIPKSLREALNNEGWQVGRSPIHHIARSLDGTIKVLLRLEDNRLVETVGIPVFAEPKKIGEPGKIERLTACVSSQVGCALKCAFCATGKGGFARNLKPHEIIEQVLVIEELLKARVSNIVFMGMGEPLMNLPALIPAVKALNQEVAIGQRMMTISTVGVPNTIARLASYKLQSNLAISLHAPNQQLRAQIVPSAKGYPLEALLTDCNNYFHETGRRVSIEYTLLSGVNDSPEQAEELARLLHHWKLGRHVNVIPYNPIADSLFRRPTNAQVKAFVDTLNKQHVTTTLRRTRGLDANAACGQLRNDFQKVPIRDSEAPMMAS
ncbi:unnamed protein product [Calypogeia fissa]